MTRLSIIVLTYNSSAIVRDCLRSLPHSIGELDTEVIVVDNHSQDDTCELIEREFPRVRLIRSPQNGGFATGNNQGLATACGDYVLLLNPDVIAASGSLAALVAFMDSRSDVGIAGCRTFTGQGEIALTAYGNYTPFKVLWQYFGLTHLLPNRAFDEYLPLCRTATKPFACAWVQAHCMLIRRDVYAQIGGLDEGLFMFAEEPDYCEKARTGGWKVIFFPGAQVTHNELTTVSRYPLVKMAHYHLSPLYYFRKRGQRGAVWLLKIGFTLELGIKWIIRLVQRIIRTNGAHSAKIRAYPEVIQEVWRF